jgi:nicotinate-nucleotide adenylyltransferase
MGKVGILGGSFDPPHVGHVIMARTARERLGLDRVLLAPAPRPPHKQRRRLSPYEERVEMARLAAAGEAGIDVSTLEEGSSAPSYTVELLRKYRRLYDDDIYFIMGADSLVDLPLWRSPQEILLMTTLVVFPRKGSVSVLRVPGEAALVIFESPVIDVSSSGIRRRVRAGRPIEALVPPAVRRYILDRGLYAR